MYDSNAFVGSKGNIEPQTFCVRAFLYVFRRCFSLFRYKLGRFCASQKQVARRKAFRQSGASVGMDLEAVVAHEQTGLPHWQIALSQSAFYVSFYACLLCQRFGHWQIWAHRSFSFPYFPFPFAARNVSKCICSLSFSLSQICAWYLLFTRAHSCPFTYAAACTTSPLASSFLHFASLSRHTRLFCSAPRRRFSIHCFAVSLTQIFPPSRFRKTSCQTGLYAHRYTDAAKSQRAFSAILTRLATTAGLNPFSLKMATTVIAYYHKILLNTHLCAISRTTTFLWSRRYLPTIFPVCNSCYFCNEAIFLTLAISPALVGMHNESAAQVSFLWLGPGLISSLISFKGDNKISWHQIFYRDKAVLKRLSSPRQHDIVVCNCCTKRHSPISGICLHDCSFEPPYLYVCHKFVYRQSVEDLIAFRRCP